MRFTTDPTGLRAATRAGAPLTNGAFLRGLAAERDVQDAFLAELRAVPSPAYCFETPAWTPARLDAPFTFRCVDSPALAHAVADPEPFRAHFRADRPAVAFESLGKDALLVAPCPAGPPEAYAHLAVFVRSAPEAQVRALWALAAERLLGALGPAPRWFSTAGLGVSWLHVRLDTRPKYYRTAAWR